MLLLVAAVLAAEPDPTLLPSALGGLAVSSPGFALALWIIARLWKERDEERAAWAKERVDERAAWVVERERELQVQERLVAAVLESTKANGQSTDVMQQTTRIMEQVVRVLG